MYYIPSLLSGTLSAIITVGTVPTGRPFDPHHLVLTTGSHHRSSPPVFTTSPHHWFSPPVLTTDLHHQSSPPVLTTGPHNRSSPPHDRLTVIMMVTVDTISMVVIMATMHKLGLDRA